MSLLSSFVVGHLLSALETEFVAHAPDLQAGFVAEVEDLASQILGWIESKSIATTSTPSVSSPPLDAAIV